MRYRALLVAAAAALVVTPALGEDPAEAYCSANGYDAEFDKDLTAYRDSDGEKIKCGDIVEADDDLWAKCCCDDDEYCCKDTFGGRRRQHGFYVRRRRLHAGVVQRHLRRLPAVSA